MAFDFSRFRDPPLDEAYVEYLLGDEMVDRTIVLERLWSYYRNELDGLEGGLPLASGDWVDVARPYRQPQEFGLPARITGESHLGYGGLAAAGEGLRRKEVVIENDIGWRIDTGVHFLFSKAPEVESLAPDAARARLIERTLAEVHRANGGVSLWQETALLGSVFGFVDLAVRLDRGLSRVDGRWVRLTEDGPEDVDPLEMIRIEPIEAPRIVPILDEDDGRRIRFLLVHYRKLLNRLSGGTRTDEVGSPATAVVTEVLGPRWWQIYEDGELVAEGPNILGEPPVVHIQNLPVPGRYEGAGDVEPLIPLQDELNTRLSDRATRVTFQSFKMYLGRGIDNFENRPVAPGRMWATDNPEAGIEEFGGDAESPSESAHIAELREAMDKVSGVTPLVAGLLKDRLGNLTSASALRVTLMGTLARVERKRMTYGEGLVRLNTMLLALLDRTGIFPNTPDERSTRLHWPSPLPEDEGERLSQARIKLEVGVPRSEVLRELGYTEKEA